MTREVPGGREPSEDERERYFRRLTEPYSPFTFELPDPHPAMDRPGWRIFRTGGGQSRREWITAVVFLILVLGLAALVIVRSERRAAEGPAAPLTFRGPDFAMQSIVDRVFHDADWYPHLVRVYDEDATGEVEVRTDLTTDGAPSDLVERMCVDVASVADAERVIVTSAVADEIFRCSA